jgi:hypothetical protein
VFSVPFDRNGYYFSWINFDNSVAFDIVKREPHRKKTFVKSATQFNVSEDLPQHIIKRIRNGNHAR